MELSCAFQSYDWGKCGLDSVVAMLLESSDKFFQPEHKPYAELWMGTHPKGPSYLKHNNQVLEAYIQSNKEILGEEVLKQFGGLPFLFKVLSVNKALSIQAHPNKEKAVELHRQFPHIYRDKNYKPELAIALTPFDALCGFRPIREIKEYLKSVPELCNVIGEKEVSEFLNAEEANAQAALKKCFCNLVTGDPGTIALQLRKLLDRMSKSDDSSRQALHAGLLERLYSDYPGDVGCFAPYIFNFISMQPGEAIYFGPNEPHAYLSGDCIECMACSDNVIRAGLTPKMKDVETLVSMLTYNCEPASAKRFQPSRDDECTELFRPPVPEFAVAKITIPPGRAKYNLIPRSTASILIIVNGKAEISPGKVLDRGSVIFIAANEKISMKILCGCHPMLMFQAFVNV